MSTFTYMNEKQRDIHIWAATGLVEHREPAGMVQWETSLLAGLWSNQGRLTYATLYKWLDFIIDFSQSKDHRKVPRGKIRRGALVRFEDILKANKVENYNPNPDPRIEVFTFRKAATGVALKTDQQLHAVIQHHDNRPCAPGHYMLYLGEFTNIGKADDPIIGSLQDLIAVAPKVKTVTMFSQCEKIVQADAGSRNDKTRGHVRVRDNHCLISKLDAMKSARGTDYTALEVAHIFPLALAEKAVKFLECEELGDVLKYAKTRKAADCPENAILLRSDLHRFFDQYQWSIYDGKIYVFEEKYPKVLDPFFGDTVELPSEVSEAVLLHHFWTCLRLRMAGWGYLRNYVSETAQESEI